MLLAQVATFAALSVGAPPSALAVFHGVWTPIAPTPPVPAPRRDMPFIYDAPRDRLVVVGGNGETWTMPAGNTVAWTKLSIPNFASTGYDHGFYDAVGDRMVVLRSDMQVFTLDLATPQGWTPLAVQGTPPTARAWFASALDVTRNRILIFGGGIFPSLNDVWALSLSDPPTWSQVLPTGSGPPPLWGAVAAYDPIGDRLIFGMGSTTPSYTVNFWLYSLELSGPPTWSRLDVSGIPPEGRMLPAFCYDPGLHRIVVFSGYPTAQNDTWSLELTGSPNWVQLTPEGEAPPYQWSSAMVYRTASPSLWLYGGHSGSDFTGLWRLTAGQAIELPQISLFVPSGGAVGDEVSIHGMWLADATEVQFNGVPALILSATNTLLRAIVPSGATTGPISVTTPFGTATSAASFLVGERPVIVSFDPDSGKAGDGITVLGEHFTGVTQVRLGGTGTAPFTVVNDGTLLVTVDTLASTGPIHVSSPSGTGTSAGIFTRLQDDPRPRLLSVRDVRGDQGGKVTLRWLASDFDQPRYKKITGYRIWRRAPANSVRAARPQGSVPAPAPPTTDATAADPEFWESIAQLPAAYLKGYSYTAATLVDSTENGNPRSAFFVQAITASAFEFYNSSPDSGYSVDDLAPPAPAPLTVLYGPAKNSLHWRGTTLADLHGYRLHRGSEAAFVPSAANLIAATDDTTFEDAAGSHFYKLTAVDIHGNRSKFVAASPDRPVAALVSFHQAQRSPGLVRVVWYSGGNPGLQASVYRRSEGQDWERIGNVAADGLGYLTFEDRTAEPFLRYGYRLGVVDVEPDESFLGEGWVEPLAVALAFQGRILNPSPDGRIHCALQVPAGVRVDLQLFDISGREVESQQLEAGSAGERVVHFGASTKLRSGVYLLRASGAQWTLHRRVTVLN